MRSLSSPRSFTIAIGEEALDDLTSWAEPELLADDIRTFFAAHA